MDIQLPLIVRGFCEQVANATGGGADYWVRAGLLREEGNDRAILIFQLRQVEKNVLYSSTEDLLFLQYMAILKGREEDYGRAKANDMLKEMSKLLAT